MTTGEHQIGKDEEGSGRNLIWGALFLFV
jgi:hypothetical protein